MKDKELTLCEGSAVHLFRMHLLVVLKAKTPTENLHGIQNGTDRVLLVVLLVIMIHYGRVVTIVSIWLKRNGSRLAVVPNVLEGQVERVDHGGGDTRSVEGKVLFGRHFEARGLDLEGFLDDNVRHGGGKLLEMCELWQESMDRNW